PRALNILALQLPYPRQTARDTIPTPEVSVCCNQSLRYLRHIRWSRDRHPVAKPAGHWSHNRFASEYDTGQPDLATDRLDPRGFRRESTKMTVPRTPTARSGQSRRGS